MSKTKAELEAEVASLTEQVEALKSGDTAGLHEEITALKAENTTLKDTVTELNERLAATEAARGENAAPLVKVGSDTYQVVRGGIVPGKGTMTAKEIAGDRELCAKLLEKKSGLIVKVSK